jgi:hypothetical protein
MDIFIESWLSFGFNFMVAFAIVRFIYYPQRRDKDYVFTFFAFNTIIFFVLSLLKSVDLSVGFGFGLFAIFSVLRYRTSTIPIREMTYLFVVIALPVINSILVQEQGWEELIVANLATIAVIYTLEKEWGFHYEIRKSITYEKIEMIRPENWSSLVDDLEERTGIPIKRIEIGELNFLRDTAEINIYYDANALVNEQVVFTKNHRASSQKQIIEP